MSILEHAESSAAVQRDPGDTHQLRADSGWGEMRVALATIGPLLLTVWIVVGFGIL
jgi:hypothetical protein